jgi:hypothetical protein
MDRQHRVPVPFMPDPEYQYAGKSLSESEKTGLSMKQNLAGMLKLNLLDHHQQ